MSLASRGVLEFVLNDHSRLAVRTELKPVDVQAVQHRAVAEPRAVWVSDEVSALREGDLLMGG